MEPQGKHSLELNFVGDGVFLNFWDYMHGEDVVVEIKNGKLIFTDYETKEEKEIDFNEYLEKVKQSISLRK